MNTKEKIKIMQTYLDGETIQFKDFYGDWYNASIKDDKELIWDWNSVEYRIKPKPRTVYMEKSSDHAMEFVCWSYGSVLYLEKNPNIVKFVEEIK